MKKFVYITQNLFISVEIRERDVISGDDVDVEERFDRLLNDAEIEERVRRSVSSATRYKDEWAMRAFEAWRSNRLTLGQNDNSIRCFPMPLQYMSQLSSMTQYRFLLLKFRNKTALNILVIRCVADILNELFEIMHVKSALLR